jgi:hypothetical protein
VTLPQVAELQWVSTDAVPSLVASNSGLSLPPSSRPACGVLTFDTSIAERAPIGSAFAPAVHKQAAHPWVNRAVRSSPQPVRLWPDQLGRVKS